MLTRLAALTTVVSFATLGVLSPSPLPAPLAAAPRVDPGQLTLATERVIIFKDGYGLFVKSATGVADAEGKVHTERVPDAAVLGTFWAVPQGRALKSTIAEWFETVRPTTDEGACVSTLELLRANEGRQVTLGLGDKDVSGKLVAVLDAPALRPRAPSTEGTYETTLTPRGGELLVIEVSEGRRVLPVASVRTVTGKDLSTHCLRRGEVATRSKRLSFDFGREAAGKPVTLKVFYFTAGVRWIPTYRVDTGSTSKAGLELQAEILNEEEDFEDAAIDLVVGVPSFKFKSTVSPMSLEQTLRAALSQTMPSLMNSNLGMSNAMFASRAGERVDGEEAARAASPVMAIAADLGAEARQDLFMYPVKSLGLKKGARAMVPLWKRQVPQGHVYTVELGNASRTASDVAPQRLAENRVWHQLELTDDSDVPFTTGAALLMEAGAPLGQDLLAYTSPGGKTMIPITTALDLRAVQAEREVSRVPNATMVDNRLFTLVQKRGTVTLSSAQKQRATVRVSLATAGKVARVSHGGAVVVNEGDHTNNQSRVTWEVVVGAGATVTLDYELSVLR